MASLLALAQKDRSAPVLLNLVLDLEVHDLEELPSLDVAFVGCLPEQCRGGG